MIPAELFPPSAKCVSLQVEPDSVDLRRYEQLHPLERALVAHAVDLRKAEFGDARWCAHQALQALRRNSSQPILRGERGVPLWPASVSGSLTHTKGLRAAVVAPRLIVRSMGLDAEQALPLPPGVLESISRENERSQIQRLQAEGLECADRLLFSAKEATYKAWFPLTHRWLGFDQAEIDLRSDGTFMSYLLARPTPLAAIEGRWAIVNGFIIAVTSVT
ncbi:4'-phosphopantetheinyl transferase [Corynebacterium sp. HS2168-gen11]|uniref:4'-phosphopantetheinyl transferase family protein n=1 Tax=Corynebacterium sp. HS2168-gen11 TaxID=2974027 RepID=UPI00216B1229|nr:4'-phosphopantetheinyl transferase superfamily protein [Corynebacterium sp. HS2168-gen11]MCS4536325.1 4'-phosphopantetheinyl transferase superfamily protein [Corynebacterium sp. HS2168-gen11]